MSRGVVAGRLARERLPWVICGREDGLGKRWVWLVAGALVVGIWSSRDHEQPEVKPEAVVGPAAKPKPEPPSTKTPSPARSVGNWYDNYDPADFAAPVRKSAQRAGVDPVLVMAILYNEDYKPHNPELERSWQRIKPDAAFGIANMHRAAFNETKRGRSFAKRRWEELPDHPELAIEAAAYHLRDLANRLPSKRATSLSRNELMALGYNAGSGNMRAFARGANPGPQAQTYLDNLQKNWPKSAQALS
ncbi:transglycosylase SLT domain-containing protein [Kribbella sandramycini]|uniref:Soluble lytic murein transglycosylase-like protein n=1 Tax=Kribbella sandramycini TaxID=60450 RepID=A0A7Y4KY03_9ACTN|nr:transglycosylase SLT domain-containing protein [Kribbella sandramycini]MBB6569417.1 soluble lytic murein transglycosylase-like protein [Kribbella sandramycini]NOL40747.1 transglycosylase SLT domain-containing protein [Kribbella sandramycini]